jgi:penicillin amidase
MREALRRVEDLFRVSTPASQSAAPNSIAPPAAGGSNQWTVSGQWTASGKPLLANDTHLLLQIPAPWYQIHLSGGGYDVTGVSLPGLPTVAVGHNEHCAWGMTIAWHDAQDLFMHRLNPDNPHQYEYEGEWLDADVLRESIRVKGQDEPVIQEVVITRHGPIISELVGAGMPLALRWVALEPHDLLVANLRCNRARNWDEFRTALGDWNAPSLNFVCADRDGNIGYLQVGRVPIRAGGPALAPVPGWTREYEWQGYLSPDQLPQDVNPESGRLLTANNLVVDGAYPHYLSADLENPCRARRIADLLDAQAAKGYTAEDFARFQLDTYSAQAERFVQHMLTVEPQSDLERRALDHLRAWDGCLAAESVAASIYQVCRLRALHIVFDVHLGELADAYVGAQGLTVLGESSPYHGKSIVRLLDLLDGRGNDYWLRDPVTGHERPRHELLGRALQEALERLEAELGPDMSRWTWGRVNRVHFAHTLGSVKPLHLLFNRGPYPMGGDQDTLLRASTNPGFPREPVGVVDAVRFIADLDDWEQCRIVVPGGQSGHVGSPHYADLIPLWRKGHYQPMPFGRDRVERYARSRLTLVPKG